MEKTALMNVTSRMRPNIPLKGSDNWGSASFSERTLGNHYLFYSQKSEFLISMQFAKKTLTHCIMCSRSSFNTFFPTGLNVREWSQVHSISTASSQARNSRNLKHLDDQALERLALTGGLHETSGTTVTKFGLDERQLSMATKDFLVSHGLASDPHRQSKERDRSPVAGRPKDISEFLKQPKLTSL